MKKGDQTIALLPDPFLDANIIPHFYRKIFPFFSQPYGIGGGKRRKRFDNGHFLCLAGFANMPLYRSLSSFPNICFRLAAQLALYRIIIRRRERVACLATATSHKEPYGIAAVKQLLAFDSGNSMHNA